MKHLIKRTLAIPWYGINKLQSNLIILTYHSVHPTYWNSVTPENFEKQLQYLLSNFTVISIYQLIDMLNNDRKPSVNSIVLTFDDGYADNYEYAYKILRIYNCPATIFVCTGFVDGSIDITKYSDSYKGLKALNWAQIKEMSDDGITFGAHTHSHVKLTAVPPQTAEKEILLSKEMLQNAAGKPVDIFAYPWGLFNHTTVNILKDNGFIAACSTRCSTKNRKRNLFALRRVDVDATDSLKEFQLKVNGGYNFIGLMKRT